MLKVILEQLASTYSTISLDPVKSLLTLGGLYRSYRSMIRPTIVRNKYIFSIIRFKHREAFKNIELTNDLKEHLKNLRSIKASFGLINNKLGFTVIDCSRPSIKDYMSLRTLVLRKEKREMNRIVLVETLNSVFVFHAKGCSTLNDSDFTFLMTKLFDKSADKYKELDASPIKNFRIELNKSLKKRVVFYDVGTEKFVIAVPRFVVLGNDYQKSLGFYVRLEDRNKLFGNVIDLEKLIPKNSFKFLDVLSFKGFKTSDAINSLIKYLPREIVYEIFDSRSISLGDFYDFLCFFCKENGTNFFICDPETDNKRDFDSGITIVHGTYVCPGPASYLISLNHDKKVKIVDDDNCGYESTKTGEDKRIEVKLRFINPSDRIELTENCFIKENRKYREISSIMLK